MYVGLSYIGCELWGGWMCMWLWLWSWWIWFREESDSVSETRESFSDSCSDESESEKLWRWDGCSSEEGMCEQDSLCLWHQNERLGNLYLQYFERSSPYGRVPLTDKVTLCYNSILYSCFSFLYWNYWSFGSQISSLAQRHPGLMSLRSVDLSPASWMAVAWLASSLRVTVISNMDSNPNAIHPGTLSITFPRVEPLETCKRAFSRTTPFLLPSKVRIPSLFIVSFHKPLNAGNYDRYGVSRRGWEFEEENKGRGKYLPPPLRVVHLQNARGCVVIGQEWSGPWENGVAVERRGFMAKAIAGPTSWLQLLHGNEAWLAVQ